MTRILLIEDDADIREGVRLLLSAEGYEIIEADCGTKGLEQLDESIDLVILDVMMPGISGIKTCEEIRKVSYVPVLFLTAKSSETDKVMGLMAGGDDYIIKPFSYAELLGRVKALLRRYHVYSGKKTVEETAAEQTIIQVGDIKINELMKGVWKNNRPIRVTEIEYKILLLLMKHPGKVFSAQQVYESVWKEPYLYASNSTIMVHIRNLRIKIENVPESPEHIKTVWGKGYRFE
ncbi:MAG: response regulator transcription factor [Butyricicoccus sp.]|nr:response regulator transcription factor [Butyricicoccus sp.]MDY4087757.1 response regulator transcription factor [Butyricicoccus intestinisimiae]